MKITTTYLKQVIKEEIEKVLEEGRFDDDRTEEEKDAIARLGIDAAQAERKWNMGKIEYLQRNPEKYEEFAAAAAEKGLIDPTNSNLFKDKEEFIAAVKRGTRDGLGTLTKLGNKLMRNPDFPKGKFFDAYDSIQSHKRFTPDDKKTLDNMHQRWQRRREGLEEGQTKTVQGVIDDLAANDAKRRMALPDIEACAEGYGDPGIKQFYPGWTERDFQAVVDGLEKLGKA